MAVSTIAGNYGGGIPVTCILDEGAPTVTASGTYFGATGETEQVLSWATPVVEGEWVACSNDTACTFTACGGIPCVERPVNAETLILGRIVSTPKLQTMPANDDAADTLAERLTGGYYRTAVVEIYAGITAIVKATVTEADTSHALVQMNPATASYDISASHAAGGLVLLEAATGGTGYLPLHYVPAVVGDYSCLIGITGPMIAQT
jgi:hypothetical protein